MRQPVFESTRAATIHAPAADGNPVIDAFAVAIAVTPRRHWWRRLGLGALAAGALS